MSLRSEIQLPALHVNGLGKGNLDMSLSYTTILAL